MMDKLKVGMSIKNGSMKLTIIEFFEINNTNLALLLRHEDGMFITVRDLTFYNGEHIWWWGHYIPLLLDACKDFNMRKKDLQSR